MTQHITQVDYIFTKITLAVGVVSRKLILRVTYARLQLLDLCLNCCCKSLAASAKTCLRGFILTDRHHRRRRCADFDPVGHHRSNPSWQIASVPVLAVVHRHFIPGVDPLGVRAFQFLAAIAGVHVEFCLVEIQAARSLPVPAAFVCLRD